MKALRICVIPARGGSKRIPRKNIKSFCGKPIIAYPIEAALASGLFDQVIVSTDDNEIAEVALAYGATVPFKRPAHLSDDHTATVPVLLHALEWVEQHGSKVSEMSCLYPSTPFLNAELLNAAYAHWKNTLAEFCFAVSEYPSAPQRGLNMNAEGRMSSMYPEFRLSRTQDLDKAYFDVGQFYFCDAQAFKKELNLHSPKACGYVLPKFLAHDIDTLDDWHLAEMFYQVLPKLSQNKTPQ